MRRTGRSLAGTLHDSTHFFVPRLKAEGQLGPLGQGFQLVMGSATGNMAVGALSPLMTHY